MISSFAYDCYYQLSGTAVIAVLAEVDTLPGAEIQASIGDRNGDADTAQCGLGVSRHVIGALQGMLILWTVLRNQTVEDGLHIHTNIRICILIDAQSATGMLRENVQDTNLRQFWQLAHDFTRHQVETSAFRFQYDLYLLYHIT